MLLCELAIKIQLKVSLDCSFDPEDRTKVGNVRYCIIDNVRRVPKEIIVWADSRERLLYLNPNCEIREKDAGLEFTYKPLSVVEKVPHGEMPKGFFLHIPLSQIAKPYEVVRLPG